MPVPPGDQTAQVIWGSQALTAAYADDSQNHETLLTYGYSRVVLSCDLSAVGGLVVGNRVDVQVFYRYTATSSWVQYNWETTAVGAQTAVTELDPREWHYFLRSLAAQQWSIEVPVKGRALKVMARAGVGAPGAAALAVSAMRWLP